MVHLIQHVKTRLLGSDHKHATCACMQACTPVLVALCGEILLLGFNYQWSSPYYMQAKQAQRTKKTKNHCSTGLYSILKVFKGK